MNRVRWIALACTLTTAACAGDSLTVGENDASLGFLVNADASSDTGPVDAHTAEAGDGDAGLHDAAPTDVARVDPTDAGPTDAMPTDAGPTDAGPTDAGPTDAGPVDSGAADAGTPDVTTATSGSLIVRMAGNPSTARVTVSGPGAFAQTLETTATLNDLAFGSYAVSAPPAVYDGLSYVARIEGSPARVSADGPATVVVTYSSMNNPPTITAPSQHTLYAGALTPTVLPFTVDDVEDGPVGLRPTVVSSAPETVTASLTAQGSAWDLSLLPGTAAGSAVVTLSVTDSQGTVTRLAINVAVTTAGVVTTDADSGPGSLRAVIAAVPAGATVTFAPSVRGTIRFNSSIAVSRSIIIQGPGAGALAIDGRGDVQLFYITAPLTVSGLSFNNGYAGAYGGALQVTSASAPLTVRGCDFTGNSAGTYGGAIYTTGGITLSRCTFTSNRAANGGAVLAQGPRSVITDCTFRTNAATQHYGGGLLALSSGQTEIERCAFLSNTSAHSGGALVQQGVGVRMNIVNSTFAANVAPNGSAITENGLALTMAHSTVTGSTGGPALHIMNGTFSLRACIVSGNPNGDFTAFGHYESGDYNLLGGTRGASLSLMGHDRVGASVALDPVSNYGGLTPTVRLPSTSLAVDAIPPTDCRSFTGALAADQRGDARPVGRGCDIGAFERHGAD